MRAQTPSVTPTPSSWVTSGCADFYPTWDKRELPDTPENERRAQACVESSPYDALGCPQLAQKLSQEHRAGITFSESDLSMWRQCAPLNPSNSAKPGLKFGRPSPGRAYTSHEPLPPFLQHPVIVHTPTPAPAGELAPGASSPTSCSSSLGPIATFVEFAGGNMQASPTASMLKNGRYHGHASELDGQSSICS